MKIDLKHSLKLTKELKLPEIISNILLEEELPYNLYVHFGNAGEFFLMSEEEQSEYSNGNIIPLWDDGNFDRVTAYNTKTKNYVTFYIEDPDEGLSHQLTYEQLMATEFKELWEAEKDRTDLKEIAKLFNYSGIQSFLDNMAKINDLEYDEYEQQFIIYQKSISA